jgi:hypothetical protein
VLISVDRMVDVNVVDRMTGTVLVLRIVDIKVWRMGTVFVLKCVSTIVDVKVDGGAGTSLVLRMVVVNVELATGRVLVLKSVVVKVVLAIGRVLVLYIVLVKVVFAIG